MKLVNVTSITDILKKVYNNKNNIDGKISIEAVLYILFSQDFYDTDEMIKELNNCSFIDNQLNKVVDLEDAINIITKGKNDLA